MQRDVHHIIHTRNMWSIYKQGAQIRNTPSLLIRMDRSDHNEIHDNCPAIPVPSYHVLAKVAGIFIPTRDTLQTVDNLMFAVDEALKHPKCREIERGLGQLTIQALEEQRPYLFDILGKEERRHG